MTACRGTTFYPVSLYESSTLPLPPLQPKSMHEGRVSDDNLTGYLVMKGGCRVLIYQSNFLTELYSDLNNVFVSPRVALLALEPEAEDALFRYLSTDLRADIEAV